MGGDRFVTTGLQRFPTAESSGFAFVDRGRESDLLLEALEHPPAVVMVEGEAGVGKSRLVHEVTAELPLQDRRILTGYCHPLREPSPYGPVIDALRQVGPWLPPASQMNPSAGALTSLLPELADHLPPAPQEAHEGPGRYQLARAVRAVLEVCDRVVVIIEDLHWADEATRELLLLLARELPPRASLVFTYRREELSPRSPVLGTAYQRPPGTSGAEIHLRPLVEADIHALASAVLGPRANPAIGRLLFDRSAGLPLVVEEDLITLGEGQRGHLHDEVIDPVEELGQAVLPRGLREALAARVYGLSSEAIAVVEAAAAMSVPADEALLTHLAGLDAEAGSHALMEALQASVLRETDPFLYGFRHSLAQQVMYQTISEPQRRHLHQQAIESLRKLDSPPLVQIAHHHRALGDREGWLAQAEAAADQALALGDQGTAAALLNAILAEPQLEESLRTRAALALSRTAAFSLDYAASVSVLRRILADQQLPAATRGEIRVGLGLILLNQAGSHVGMQDMEQAVAEMGDQRPEPASRAMAALGLFMADGGWPAAEALQWIERAEQTVQASDDEAARAAVHTNKLAVLAHLGAPEAWDLVDQLPRLGKPTPVLRQTARALYNAADVALNLGHDERVGGLLDECQDLARRTGASLHDGLCGILRQELDWHCGEWGNLETGYAALTAEFPDLRMLEVEGSLVLGALAEARGQWNQALETYPLPTDVSEYHMILAGEAAAGIARIKLAQHDPQAAWATIAQAVEGLRTHGVWLASAGLVSVAVEVALATARPQEASRLTEGLERSLVDRDAPAASAQLYQCRGLLQYDSAPSRAREQFELARATYDAIGRPYSAAQAAERAARTLIPSAPEEASRELTHIAETYTRLGAASGAARCQQALRSLGLAQPSSRGRHGYGSQLSPRERQVAHLLAVGATNRDIAQALFLSPRTVEHHVAKVLKKLGAADRKAVQEALTTHDA
ncbi:AAA family ATPase [Streptomyces sp. NBC_00879]|uniref:helix-turn-helix transcriptional regulator n=1 Tax=Streptomyces sp. NBC_00879 TaxID=2975855 RepID=UPI0038676E6D|nr:AAA family ATPase [Streptomyces sp. NBC_00879]